MFKTLVFLLAFSITSYSDPLNSSLELQTSTADSYEARSTLVNPAALGFQTELNGSALLSSLTFAHNKGQSSELSFGLAYGYLGFGFERLLSPTEPWNRFSFAAGMPLTHQVFFGSRFSVTGSDDPALSGIHSFDLGLQYRPLEFLSVGILANRLNHPKISGVEAPSQWVGSLTLEPIRHLRVSVDVDTLSNNFGSDLGYQAFAKYEVLPGLDLAAGYHKTYEFSVGIQFALGQSTVFSYVQPRSDAKKWTLGFQTTTEPRRSFILPNRTIKVTLDSRLSEEGAPGTFFSKPEPSFLSLLRRIEEGSKDPYTKAIIIKLESFPLGFAAAEELNEALYQFREKGKVVEVFLGNAGLREYLVASAASKIYMEPSAELRILGPRSERFYVKGTLDKIGIQGEFLAKGEYKSAPETFTRKDASPQNREATLAELKALEDGIQALLSKSRKNLPAWKDLLNFALFSAQDAKSKGMIDEVRSFSDTSTLSSQDPPILNAATYQKARLDLPKKVAVIVADGDILQKRFRLLSLAGSSQITPEKMRQRLKEAKEDPLTKAIVIRVSSPGGEILASQEIASMIESTKTKMPVVISMGDVAASGGYLISAPATRIFADQLTITGSIGVFLGKVSLEALYKKIDLKKEILGSSPYASLYSESQSWKPHEKNLMLRRLNDYYGSFVSYVSEKRKISQADAEKAAKGRVWVAPDALKFKLIDEEGGLVTAIQHAASLAQLQNYEVEMVAETINLFSFGEGDFFVQEPELLKGALSLLGTDHLRELQWMVSLGKNPFLFWSPHLYTD